MAQPEGLVVTASALKEAEANVHLAGHRAAGDARRSRRRGEDRGPRPRSPPRGARLVGRARRRGGRGPRVAARRARRQRGAAPDAGAPLGRRGGPVRARRDAGRAPRRGSRRRHGRRDDPPLGRQDPPQPAELAADDSVDVRFDPAIGRSGSTSLERSAQRLWSEIQLYVGRHRSRFVWSGNAGQVTPARERDNLPCVTMLRWRSASAAMLAYLAGTSCLLIPLDSGDDPGTVSVSKTSGSDLSELACASSDPANCSCQPSESGSGTCPESPSSITTCCRDDLEGGCYCRTPVVSCHIYSGELPIDTSCACGSGGGDTATVTDTCALENVPWSRCCQNTITGDCTCRTFGTECSNYGEIKVESCIAASTDAGCGFTSGTCLCTDFLKVGDAPSCPSSATPICCLRPGYCSCSYNGKCPEDEQQVASCTADIVTPVAPTCGLSEHAVEACR